MKYLLLLLFPMFPAVAQNLTNYVDPFVGTQARASGEILLNGKAGNVYPGASVPFGMVQWSPETETEPGQSSTFDYDKEKFTGFALTHMSGGGCVESGELPLDPTVGDGEVSNDLAFVREADAPGVARPGYYSVGLTNGVRLELTRPKTHLSILKMRARS